MYTKKVIPFTKAWGTVIGIRFLVFGLLGGGCTPVPAATQAEILPSETPAATPQDGQAQETPLHTLSADGINPETEVVFTITNDEPLSGVAGEPVPDWLAWGAQAFTVAPDGSFWILDEAAAHPPRLLHYGPEGARLGEISLEGQVAGAVDVVVGEVIWVLDIASQPARVVSFDRDGLLLDAVSIPETLFEHEGVYVSNMLDDLQLGEWGELVLKGPAGPDLYEFLDEAGETSARRLEGADYGGHLYRTEYPDLVIVDGHSIEIDPVTPDGNVIGIDLLGVRPDGDFYAAVTEERVMAGQTTGYLRVVHAYTLNGDHLGVSLPPESAVWVESNRDLAVGLDGALYALVSREDHSVEVLRLGFAPELSVTPAPVPPVSPVPLTPLLPAWATPPPGVPDLEIARNALLAFFTYLNEGRYSDAAALYGGPLDAIIVPDPGSPPADPGQFWEEACFLLQCLLVADIVEEEQVAPDEFRFLVEFMWDDGTRFVLGPCCGASKADMPPVWQFPYTVKVVAGQFVVMEPPQYVP